LKVRIAVTKPWQALLPNIAVKRMKYLSVVASQAAPISQNNPQSTVLNAAPPIGEAVGESQLTAVFQPMLAISDGTIFGFEGLIRGVHPDWRDPLALFSAAAAAGLSERLDQNAITTVVSAFIELGLPGKLFLNVLPSTLIRSDRVDFSLSAFLINSDIQPERIVIEIGESQPIDNLVELKRNLKVLRSLGFQIAIDDLGQAYASLRVWLELRPDFVKVDLQFVRGIHRDSFKSEFVRAISHICKTTDTLLIAEGIEEEAELLTLRDLGAHFAQGYFIGRPHARPQPEIHFDIKKALSVQRIAVLAEHHAQAGSFQRSSMQIGKLLQPVIPVAANTSNQVVMERFACDPNLTSIPVVADSIPIGLISRASFVHEFALPYRHELFDKRPCAMLMDKAPLIVESTLAITAVSEQLTELDHRHLASGFIITSNQLYLGMVSGQALLKELTAIQINSARYSNPLTLLPGNVPIDEHIERLLAAEIPFVVAYCDIDNFKPFNDLYGYQSGDQLIKAVAQALLKSVETSMDFVGHVGGDDFVVSMQSTDWEQRLNSTLLAFNLATSELLAPQDERRRGYIVHDRNGEQRCIPTPTLSIGVVQVGAKEYQCSADVSRALAGAKREAKKISGSSLFIDRRRRILN